MHWILVAVGGALGAVARHAVGSGLPRPEGGLPVATLLVNVLGATALGFLLAWWAEAPAGVGPRLLLGVGFLGSFTTFSTFSAELVTLYGEAGLGKAATYAGVSLALGVAGVVLGMWLAGTWLAGDSRPV